MDTTTGSRDDLITNGKYVIVQRGDQDKIIEFQVENKLRFGRGSNQQEIELKNAEGFPFYSTFRVLSTSEGNKKRTFCLEFVSETPELFLVADRNSSGKDNRDIVDDKKSQSMGQTDIALLREKGVSGPEILDTLITSSKTFTQKTEFAQEKYVKKKERAYGDTLTFIQPTLNSIADYYFKRDPIKIMNLRVDTLSQLLTYSNVYSGGKYIVYETACSGLVIAGVLQRLGGSGICLHVHTGSTPQRQALHYLNFTSEELKPLQSLDVFYLIRSANSISTSAVPVVLISEEEEEASPLIKRQKLESEDDGSELLQKKDDEIENGNSKIYRSINRVENEKSLSVLQEVSFDGLIICAKEHPLTILQNLMPHLLSSSPFVIFCQYVEPLAECFTWLKEENLGINLNIFENWFRNIQIQPERTHPEVQMSSNGGYILSGLYIASS